MTSQDLSFKSIRQWDGSQHRAFEELCYQLRDPTPGHAYLVKTGDPDGGLEWYVSFQNGVQWGWQAKFTFNIDNLLKLLEKSLKTVAKGRPRCTRLTFCIPFDLSDAVDQGKQKSARQKFEDRKRTWKNDIPGARKIRIEIWTQGELLERLTAHTNQRGIRRFFWDEEVFSKDWFSRRMAIATTTAGKRYTPELHVDLPITFVFEGLSLSKAYWSKFFAAFGAVIRTSQKINPSSLRKIGLIRKLRCFEQALRALKQLIPDRLDPPQRVRQQEMINATEVCFESILELSKPLAYSNAVGNPKIESALSPMTLHWLKSDLNKLENAIFDFNVFLRSDATKAASCGTLLMDGEAGQGKTHLFCDIGHRAVKAGRPAVVLFGGQLSGHSVWSEIAERLGLETIGSESLIGAMHAAAEASNAPFLLLIDALNDAAKPHNWQHELPAMLAEIAQDPWIRLGVSVRSTYMQIVCPSDGLSGIVQVTHQGFEGRESDAMDLFFNTFRLQQPRIPLLTPEFTNPLFLKLYCEGLEQQGLAAPNQGGAHITQVFDWYLSSKATLIASRLKLDPAASTVERALNEFSLETANRNSDYLERDSAEQIFSKFAPHLYKWPDTLLGQLLSEGILSADLAYRPDAPAPKQVIRFTYQRFADYSAALSLLEPYGNDSTRLQNALSAGKSLRKKVLKAPLGWIEALSVLVPERLNRELLDVANWKLDSADLPPGIGPPELREKSLYQAALAAYSAGVV